MNDFMEINKLNEIDKDREFIPKETDKKTDLFKESKPKESKPKEKKL
jgi:hypothetical protein